MKSSNPKSFALVFVCLAMAGNLLAFAQIKSDEAWEILRVNLNGKDTGKQTQAQNNPCKFFAEAYPRFELPMRYLSTEIAALRPSEIAHTTNDWPRRISPAAKTPGTELM